MSRARDIADSASTINALDNVTASGAELNVLDGIPATLTPTEIGYVDGVTSAIQTQLDAKGTGTVSNLADLSITSTAAEINKLDALSRGSLIYGNASAETAILTKGTANQVLTSDGTDIAWADAAAGGTSGMQILQTVTASNSTTVDLETTLDSTYDFYIIMLSNVTPVTNSAFLQMRVKTSSYLTSNYDNNQIYGKGVNSATIGNEKDVTDGMLLARYMSNASDAAAMFTVNISNVHSTSKIKPIYAYGGYKDSNSYAIGGFTQGWNSTTDAITGVRFYFTSGNISSGVFRLYGVAKS